MRAFDHPNMQDFVCPICGSNEDKPVVLVGIAGTQRDRIIKAKQVHLHCLDLVYYPDKRVVWQAW